MNIQFDASDYILLKSEEDLLYHYPKHVYGTYRPQPWSTPYQYPCLFKEICVMDNSNGPDHAMLTYIYDFVEVPKTEVEEQQ